jgi:hypothetical protein
MTKPEVGASTDSWGTKLNADLDTLDAIFSSSGTAVSFGNVTVGGTLGVTGILTANAGVKVDNITIDGTEIDLSSGDFTLDVAGDIILDAAGEQIRFHDAGTLKGFISMASDDITLKSETSDKDIIFQGNDGGSAITALTLDMSAAGAATFNSDVTATGIKGIESNNGDPVLGHFYNDNSGTAAEAVVYITNSSTTSDGLFLETTGTSFTTASGFVQDAGVIGTGSGASGGLSIMTRANADMRFYTNGHTNERMRIDTSGNVGIGTSSPSATLDISSTAQNVLDLETSHSDGALLTFINSGTVRGYIGNAEGAMGLGTTNMAIRAEGSLHFGTNGNNERIRIDTSGNVGIGTASPATPLHVVGANGILVDTEGNGDGTVYFGGISGTDRSYIARSSDDLTMWNVSNGYMRFATNNSERMRITSAGLVGIGETSPASGLVVRKDSSAGRGGEISIVNYASTAVGNEAALNFGLEASTYAADNGNFQIKGRVMATNAATDAVFSLWSGSSFAERFRIAANGDLTATDTSIGSNSDSRLKKDIVDFTYDINKFKQYKPKSFEWINKEEHGNKENMKGFLAQDIQSIDDSWIGQLEINENSKDYNIISDNISLTSKLGQKDAMYISIIQQLIQRIEVLEG